MEKELMGEKKLISWIHEPESRGIAKVNMAILGFAALVVVAWILVPAMMGFLVVALVPGVFFGLLAQKRASHLILVRVEDLEDRLRALEGQEPT